MNGATLRARLDAVERFAKLRIADGLLESTVLKERCEWLACLDLTAYMMDADRNEADNLLGSLPEDSAATLRGWVQNLAKRQVVSLREAAFNRRSRRTHMLGLVDQWEATAALIDQAIDETYIQLAREQRRDDAAARKAAKST